MRKLFLKLIPVLIIPIVLLGCTSTAKDDNSEKLKVAVSISPLKEFTEAIGGDKVDIYCIVKDNQEPHDFEFKPSDKKELMKRQLLIYNGLDLEHWIDEAVDGVDSIKLVKATKNADVITENGVEDPHVWLSLKEAIKECNVIKEALIEADEKNKEYYEQNYSEYTKQLNDLYNEYESKFESLKGKSFVTSHEAFGYLCRELGLQQKGIKGIFGEGESTIKDKAAIIEYCKANNIHVIFTEGSESSAEAESIAKEIGGKVEPIYTLETKVEGKNYLEAMKDNYETIYNSIK